jgi:UrcA family protein
MAMMTVATPAMAQDDQEDIVITGHYGRLPDNIESASQHVSYADLDLSYAADRHVLKHRIELTARYLCDRLGESDSSSSGLVPSCREAAVRDALSRIGTVEAHFAPRGTAWVAPARWEAPYPDAWDATYP